MDKLTDFFDRQGICIDDYEVSSDELEHHGVRGQKWGILHGPPYPLDSNAAKQARRKAESAANAVKEAGKEVAENVTKTTKKISGTIQEAREARKQKKLEKYNAEKKRIIEEGDVTSASDRVQDFTNEEIKSMVDRYVSTAKVRDLGELDQADEYIRKNRSTEDQKEIAGKIASADIDWAVNNSSKLTKKELDDLVEKKASMLKARDFVSNYNAKEKTEQFDRVDKRSKSAASAAKSFLGMSVTGIAFYNIAAKIYNVRHPEKKLPVIDVSDIAIGLKEAKKAKDTVDDTIPESAKAKAAKAILDVIEKKNITDL